MTTTLIDPKLIKSDSVRCGECDREVTYYNTFLSPTNESRHICWQCLAREEKGFNADRSFYRRSRRGVIPR